MDLSMARARVESTRASAGALWIMIKAAARSSLVVRSCSCSVLRQTPIHDCDLHNGDYDHHHYHRFPAYFDPPAGRC